MKTTSSLIYLFLVAVMLSGCKKDVPMSEVMSDFTVDKAQVAANGHSSVTLTVKLNNKASADRRNVIFTTSNGSFGDGSKKTVKAEYVDGALTAKASFKISTTPGEVTVAVQPEFDSRTQEFRLTKTIQAVPSVTQSLKIEPSGFGLAGNFLSEVHLTAYLKNSEGSFVSAGNKVIFEDILESGAAANGRFRNSKLATSDSSKVSATYGAPTLPLGTNIRIRATLLDAAGNKTTIKDSLTLTLNQ